MRKMNFWIVGGDGRISITAQLLAQDGHTVHAFALAPDIPGVIYEDDLGEVNTADCVILPFPVQNDQGYLATPGVPDKNYEMSFVLDKPQPGGPVLIGGFILPELVEQLEVRGLKVHDIFKRADMAVATAIPTSEGILMYAMQETPFTICGSNVIVIGYGNVGRCCAERFNALGAHVTVVTFELPQYAWANAIPGLVGIHENEIGNFLGDVDIVINTAPTATLGQAELEALKAGCLILNPASKPCTDPALAEKLGHRYLRIGHIPGKVAPWTAGVSVKNVICALLEELNY